MKEKQPPARVQLPAAKAKEPAIAPKGRGRKKTGGRRPLLGYAIFFTILVGFSILVWTSTPRKGPTGPRDPDKRAAITGLMKQALEEEQAGRPDAAAQAYRRITDMEPAFAPAYNNLANIFQQKGFHDVAILNYRKALDIDSTLISARYNLALSYYEKGLDQEAIRQWRKLLTLNPDSTIADQTQINIEVVGRKMNPLRD